MVLLIVRCCSDNLLLTNYLLADKCQSVQLNGPTNKVTLMNMIKTSLLEVQSGRHVALETSKAMKFYSAIRGPTGRTDGSFEEAKRVPGFLELFDAYYHPARRCVGPGPSKHLLPPEAQEEARAFANLFVFDLGK